MSDKPGATIMTLFYVLWKKDMIEKEFNADELLKQYSALREVCQHQLHFNFFLTEYKKRENKSDLQVLTSAAKLESWLKNHSGRKSRTWFEHQKGKFRLRSDCIEALMGHMSLPALLVERNAVTADGIIHTTIKGYRKIIVTKIYPRFERTAISSVWRPPVGEGKCSVLSMDGCEAAVFTHHAKQDRHYHKLGTEIYMVIDGQMTIEVAGDTYILSAGDMVIVRPLAIHEVKRTSKFLARVITVDCGGVDDKFVVRKSNTGGCC